jgi:hypothetical protein
VRGAIGAMQRIVHYFEKLDYIKSAHNIVYDKYSKKTCDMDLNQLPKSIKQLLFEIKSPIDIKRMKDEVEFPYIHQDPLLLLWRLQDNPDAIKYVKERLSDNFNQITEQFLKLSSLGASGFSVKGIIQTEEKNLNKLMQKRILLWENIIENDLPKFGIPLEESKLLISFDNKLSSFSNFDEMLNIILISESTNMDMDNTAFLDKAGELILEKNNFIDETLRFRKDYYEKVYLPQQKNKTILKNEKGKSVTIYKNIPMDIVQRQIQNQLSYVRQ